MKIEGNNLILFYEESGYKTLAYARSCDLQLSAETKKKGFGNSGRWAAYKKGHKSWSISSGHIFTGKAELTKLLSMVKSGAEIPVMLATIEENGFNYATVEADGRKVWKGKALLTKLVLSASKDSLATIKIELKGTGPLVNVNADWILETGNWVDKAVWIDSEQWKDGESTIDGGNYDGEMTA